MHDMDATTTLAARRFKQIRESEQYTQAAFAELLEIKNSTADIERGKTKISGHVVTLLLKNFQINPLWLFGLSHQKTLQGNGGDVSPKVVTVTNEGVENMVLVNVKAAAGYPNNIQDLDWYQELPAFALPLPEYKHATYRGFQVSGDSMLPGLNPRDWVLARAVGTINEISNNSICVIVLVDSVLVKKVLKHTDNAVITLVSLNTIYPPLTIPTEEVVEIWEVRSKITLELESSTELSSIQQLQETMEILKNEVKRLKA